MQLFECSAAMNEVTAIPSPPLSRPRAGRPTREQAEARHAELLDHALDHFLDKGFELATIDAIAGAVGMTKRTVYARYADKASLFRAAVRRAIERYAVIDPRMETAVTGDLAETLTRIAMLRIELVSSPRGLKLQRIIQTESYRFPDIFTDSYDLGSRPAIQFVADLLERETRAGNLALDDFLEGANAFMSLTVAGPVRFILAASPLSRRQVEKRVAFGVRLFLDGARKR